MIRVFGLQLEWGACVSFVAFRNERQTRPVGCCKAERFLRCPWLQVAEDRDRCAEAGKFEEVGLRVNKGPSVLPYCCIAFFFL